MNGNLARSILCSLVTSVDFGWYSSIVGVCCFFGAWSCWVNPARGQTTSVANMAMRITQENRTVCRMFISAPCFLRTRTIFPQECRRAPRNPLLEYFIDGATQAVPNLPARRTRYSRRLHRPGDCRTYRAASCRAGDCPLFPRTEAGRIRHSGNGQVFSLDVWLVPAHRHSRERRFLLCNLLSFCLRPGPSSCLIGRSDEQASGSAG